MILAAKTSALVSKNSNAWAPLPPLDHPHIYLDMGSENNIICPYCSTLYVHDKELDADKTDPANCIYKPKAA